MSDTDTETNDGRTGPMLESVDTEGLIDDLDLDLEKVFKGTKLEDAVRDEDENVGEAIGRVVGESVGRQIGEALGRKIAELVVAGVTPTEDEGQDQEEGDQEERTENEENEADEAEEGENGTEAGSDEENASETDGGTEDDANGTENGGLQYG